MSSTSTAFQAESRTEASLWAWLRVLGGVCALALVVWQVGAGPFIAGVRGVDGSALTAAVIIGGLTTVCCAWRWRMVAAGLGVRLPLVPAVAAYYRSQFLNSTLPGGVLGDVHRAMRHGLDIRDIGLGIRTVVLERLTGLAVLVAVAVIVLFALPSPMRPHMPIVTGVVVATGMGGLLVARAARRGGSRRWRWVGRTTVPAIRAGLFPGCGWVGITLTSTVVVAGHLAVFVLAARVADVTAPVMALLPLTLLALVAMALPVNVAGWGPREGVAAWAFSAAGLTAAEGVATAATYGVLTLAASLPGAGILLLSWINRGPAAAEPPARSPAPAQDPTLTVPARSPGSTGSGARPRPHGWGAVRRRHGHTGRRR